MGRARWFTLVSGIALVAVALSLGSPARIGRKESSALPSVSPTVSETPSPPIETIADEQQMKVLPARPTFVDAFAGVQVSLPTGWVEYWYPGLFSVAPAKIRLSAYPDFQSSYNTFSITLSFDEHESFNALLRDITASLTDKLSSFSPLRRTDMSIAGKHAVELQVLDLSKPAPGEPAPCWRCIFRIYLVRWSENVSIRIIVQSGPKQIQPYTPALKTFLNSFRSAPVDHHAADLVRFLNARERGADLTALMTSPATASFGNINSGSGPHVPDGYTVDRTIQIDRDRTVFDVTVDLGGGNAQVERILIGKGKAAIGDQIDGAVLNIWLLQTQQT